MLLCAPPGRQTELDQAPPLNPPSKITLDRAALISADQYRTRDVAQVGPRHLQHPSDTSAQHHLHSREREALDLGPADVRRYRERVGIGDEVDEGRPRMVERALERSPDVLGLLDPDPVDARGLGDRRVAHARPACTNVSTSWMWSSPDLVGPGRTARA